MKRDVTIVRSFRDPSIGPGKNPEIEQAAKNEYQCSRLRRSFAEGRVDVERGGLPFPQPGYFTAQVVHYLLPRAGLDKRKRRVESLTPANFNGRIQLRHFLLNQGRHFRDFLRSDNDAGIFAQVLEIRRQPCGRLIKWQQIVLVAGNDEAALTGLGVLYDRFQLLQPSDPVPSDLLAGAQLQNAISKPKCGERRADNHGSRDEKNTQDNAKSYSHFMEILLGCGRVANE